MWRRLIKPLIDADLLVYQAAFAGQYKDEETGLFVPKRFEDAAEVFDELVELICAEVWATDSPLLFLTGNKSLLPIYNRYRKSHGEEPIEYVPNFREHVASVRPYKERKSEKPYHYKNLQAYCLAKYETVVAWGMEADDLLAVYQSSRLAFLDTIICSRDKDLRQVPGMQYSWECGGQPGFGPANIPEIGDLELITKRREKADGTFVTNSKLKGTGLKFFYSQIITGDPVDTIPGLPKGGATLAYKTLKDCKTEDEMYDAVSGLYQNRYGDGGEAAMLEQARLLWMCRRLDEQGNPVQYLPPSQREVS
tara:strand:- start:6922 stop:7845 length:924 start_codon:yes stop_codon:yes gene_type:complete